MNRIISKIAGNAAAERARPRAQQRNRARGLWKILWCQHRPGWLRPWAGALRSGRTFHLLASNSKAPKKLRAGRAFTLVELLVVIAIAGILVAFLLPALAKTKGSALQIQCLGQTRQLALALQMYSPEYRDFTPWPNWGSKFQGWLYTPVDGQPPDPGDDPPSVYDGGLLWPYVKEIKIYWCPLDSTNTPYFPQRLEQLSSYIMNGAIMGYHTRPAAAKTHKLTAMNPAAFATWEPSDNPPCDPADVFNDGASYPIEAEGPSQRHNSGCNVSSFDGHAQFLKFAVFKRQQNDKPGLLWCDPDTAKGNGGRWGQDCNLWK